MQNCVNHSSLWMRDKLKNNMYSMIFFYLIEHTAVMVDILAYIFYLVFTGISYNVKKIPTRFGYLKSMYLLQKWIKISKLPVCIFKKKKKINSKLQKISLNIYTIFDFRSLIVLDELPSQRATKHKVWKVWIRQKIETHSNVCIN